MYILLLYIEVTILSIILDLNYNISFSFEVLAMCLAILTYLFGWLRILKYKLIFRNIQFFPLFFPTKIKDLFTQVQGNFFNSLTNKQIYCLTSFTPQTLRFVEYHQVALSIDTSRNTCFWPNKLNSMTANPSSTLSLFILSCFFYTSPLVRQMMLLKQNFSTIHFPLNDRM